MTPRRVKKNLENEPKTNKKEKETKESEWEKTKREIMRRYPIKEAIVNYN